MIMLIYTFNRAEIGYHSQSYCDRVDIHVLTELNSGPIVRVIVIALIYKVLTELNSGAMVRVIVIVLIYRF